MSIRPLDMQVMIPKLQEVAQMRQIENQKAGINQHEINHSQDKKQEKMQSMVQKSPEDSNLDNHADAKEEGKGTYDRRGKKKGSDINPAKNNEDDNNSGHKIDIKV